MPSTERARKYMCAVCGGRIKGRPGLQLPSKEVACEQCTATIKKACRTELEMEPPTKRFLVKFASTLSEQLPSTIVSEAMRKARAHAGGAVKITKRVLSAAERKKLQSSQFAIPDRKAYPIHDESHARNALTRVAQHGSEEEKKQVRAAVHRKYPNIEISKSDNDVDEEEPPVLGIILLKSEPDIGDVHIDSLLDDGDEGDGICMFKSPKDVPEGEDGD